MTVRYTKFSDDLIISGPHVDRDDGLAWCISYVHPDDTRGESEIHREEFYDDAEKWCEGWSAAWRQADKLIATLKDALVEPLPF